MASELQSNAALEPLQASRRLRDLAVAHGCQSDVSVLVIRTRRRAVDVDGVVGTIGTAGLGAGNAAPPQQQQQQCIQSSSHTASLSLGDRDERAGPSANLEAEGGRSVPPIVSQQHQKQRTSTPPSTTPPPPLAPLASLTNHHYHHHQHRQQVDKSIPSNWSDGFEREAEVEEEEEDEEEDVEVTNIDDVLSDLEEDSEEESGSGTSNVLQRNSPAGGEKSPEETWRTQELDRLVMEQVWTPPNSPPIQMEHTNIDDILLSAASTPPPPPPTSSRGNSSWDGNKPNPLPYQDKHSPPLENRPFGQSLQYSNSRESMQPHVTTSTPITSYSGTDRKTRVQHPGPFPGFGTTFEQTGSPSGGIGDRIASFNRRLAQVDSGGLLLLPGAEEGRRSAREEPRATMEELLAAEAREQRRAKIIRRESYVERMYKQIAAEGSSDGDGETIRHTWAYNK